MDHHFECGGKSYTLRFSVKAMLALQEHWGLKSLQDLSDFLNQKTILQIPDMAAIMWASLRRYHQNISKDEAMNLIDDLGIEATNKIIDDLLRASNPAVETAVAAGDPVPMNP